LIAKPGSKRLAISGIFRYINGGKADENLDSSLFLNNGVNSIIHKIGLTCMALLIALASGPWTGQGATAVFTTDDDLIVGARAIVIGKVLALACRLDAEQDRIFTYVTLSVEETLKGDIGERQIVLKEEGGEVAGQGSIIFGTPQFRRGERVLLYLDTWRDGSLRVHQLSFGKLTIIDDPANGQAALVRAEPVCESRTDQAAQHHSGARVSDPIHLADYRRMVRERLAVNWQRAQSFEAENYAEVPMLAEPREYDLARSRGEMQTQFILLYPVKSVRWFDPDDNQPVTFYINPDGAPNPQVIDDVGAAMNAWSNVAGCRLRVVNGGARNICATQRNLNAITFNNCDLRFSPTPQQGRIIALGGLKWTTDITKQINGQTFVKAAYGFVSFNPYTAESYNNHCNLREVATHELGHALGLGHSQYPDATMLGTAHFDGRCASITEDDANGISFIYPVNDLGPRPLAIDSGSTLTDGVDQIRYTQALLSSGGILPHTWSLVPGYGRLPNGLALNTGGIVTGVPLETGSFNFKALVEDGIGSIQEKAFSVIVRAPLPYDSRYLSQSVISTVQAGQPFSMSLKWFNVGSQMWEASTVMLASQNPADNATWGAASFPVSGFTLKSEPLVIQLTLTAPRVAGTYNFQWQLVQAGKGVFGQPSANLQIIVTPGPPTIESAGPLQAVAGTPFTYQLVVVGGTPPFIWSIDSGALPAGVSLNSQNGLISGTPIAAGSSTFTAQVIDAASRAAQKSLSIMVAPVGPLPLKLSLPAPLPAVRGEPFIYQPEATGGTPPYTWSVAAGALPAGLALNAGTGAVTGTASASGEFDFSLAVRDQHNDSATGSIVIKVTEPLPTPVISKVKYKSGKRKLIVNGERFNANAALFVDGVQEQARFDAGALIAKPLSLSPGTHEIRVVNPGGSSSPPYSLTIE
jgi:Matrixin/Putative Ig domain